MKFLTGLLAVMLVTACQTAHQFAMPDSSWKAHIGQLKYSDRKRTLIGDVVVQRRGAQDFQLDFQKGGGFTLLTLREDAVAARADGILARGAWQGPVEKAPKQLRDWLALREAFLNPAHGASWKGEGKTADGNLASLFFSFPATEQRFVFQFSR